MARYSDPLAIYTHQRAAFEQSGRTARQAWRQIPEAAFRDFRELSSGTVSSASLRRMGHPYARQANGVGRGPSQGYAKRQGLKRVRGTAPLLPVNRQSGALYRSVTLWHRSSAFSLEVAAGFDAGKAGRSMWSIQPKGTRTVVPRGVFVEVRKRGRARLRAYNDFYFRTQRQAFSKP